MDIPLLLGLALHTLAFVIVCGYYGILARVVLPSLERSLDGLAQVTTVVEIERRAVPLLVISIALFGATGAWLLFIDPEYEGIGAFRNTWSALMLLKHIVVVVFIALGVAVDMLVRRASEAEDDVRRAIALRRVRLCAEAATATGAVIILLTAAAQVAG